MSSYDIYEWMVRDVGLWLDNLTARDRLRLMNVPIILIIYQNVFAMRSTLGSLRCIPVTF